MAQGGEAMSRIKLRYVKAWVDGEGRVYHYLRRRGHALVRLPGIAGSAEFMDAYRAALDSQPAPIGVTLRSKPGSTSAAVAAYYDSRTFYVLSAGTQAKQRGILERFRDEHGDKPLKLLPRKFIVEQLDGMAPHSARNWLKALRAFLQWCATRDLIREDPTFGIKVKVPRSDGHHTWTEEEIAQFEAAHPLGTKAHLALALGLYTLQRRGDVVRMGRQHIRDGWLHVTQQKTSKPLALPIYFTELPTVLAASPCGDLTFLVTKSGKSYGANDFSEQFRKWCDDAGLQHCTFHGLRKAGCRRLAEAGCSANQIAAWSGQSLREVERYTRAADQARLARDAVVRTDDELGTPGRLYIIRAKETTRFKIGISTDPEARLKSMQTGSAVELELVLAIEVPSVRIERQAHRILEPWRVQGEWFDLGPLADYFMHRMQRDAGTIELVLTTLREVRGDMAPASLKLIRTNHEDSGGKLNPISHSGNR